MNVLNWLMAWYKSNCDGDWEHLFGVKIDTLDNPGWSIDIDLLDTPLEDKTFKMIEKNNGEDDWFFCQVKDNVFSGRGDPDKLNSILEIFKDWAES